MPIEDDDIKTTYSSDISSAELPQPGGGESEGPEGALPFNLDGHASGEPHEQGLDGGADAGVDPPVADHGAADAGPFDHEVGGQQDGGSDSGPAPEPDPDTGERP